MKIIAHAAQAPSVMTPEGAERRVLSYGGTMMAVQFTFPAGVTAPLHSHPHEQIGYVISGSLELLMDEHPPQVLTTGATYYVAPNVRHMIVTHEPTVLLDCFTPTREDFLTAEERQTDRA